MRSLEEIEQRVSYLTKRLADLRRQQDGVKSYSEGVDIGNIIRGLDSEFNTLKWVLNR